MKVLVTGPQGSGKTTQAKLLSEFLGVPLVDSGDMLRRLDDADTEDGRRLKQALERGLMAPDDIVGRVVKERVETEGYEKGFVMDGYPRSLNQMEIFDPKFDKVIYLDIDDEVVTDRLKKRGREDDIPDLIEKRLALYHQLTEPVLDYYGVQGILEKVNGNLSIEEVQSLIREKCNG